MPKIKDESALQPLRAAEGVPRSLIQKIQRVDEQAERSKLARAARRKAYMTEVGQRCRIARGSMALNDAAARIGVHRNTLWNIERGDSLPDAMELDELARLYTTTVAALLGHDDAVAPAPVQRNVRAVELGGVVYVPHFDIQASAGTGEFQDIERVIAMRPFDATYIRGDLGIQHFDLALCWVIGNSGEPVLHSRDTVMVDLRDRQVLTEGTHIVRMDNANFIKKLERRPGRVIRVSSNNDAYEPFDIIGGDDSQRDFEVIGRVRWAGVTFQ